MTIAHRSILARAGTVAVLAAGALAAVAAPAHASDQAEIALAPISSQLAKGVEEARAKPFKFTVTNSGPGTARNVHYRLNAAELNPTRVGWVVPVGCRLLTPNLYDCPLGDLPAGTTQDFGVPLFSTGDRGDGGRLIVGISSDNWERDPADVVEVPVTVTRRGYDLTTWVQDVYANVRVDGVQEKETDLRPVRPGGTAPLDWAVYNHGSRKATGIFYGITLPAGVTFDRLPGSCSAQVINGLAQALCQDDGAVIRPGQYYTDEVWVKVAEDVTEPVLRPGDIFGYGLDEATGEPEEEARAADARQQRTFTETDKPDNHTIFDVFVDLSTEPSPSPTPTPSATPTAEPSPSGSAHPSVTPTAGDGAGGGAGGGDGGLPVTGVQVGLIGGIGVAVLVAGGLLLMLGRRRKVVLVTPTDETDGD
ncbi:cell wall anchor protein [Micromonospora sp. NPDC049836]|uniref:cell wall anchor protein n=1 Tax=Micromonospora sp. NPDC049836 TaxID=3364274 RepID=UPI00379E13F6